MSEFEEYIKNKYPEDYAVLSTMYSNQAMEELYPDQFEVWQHQQAIIDNLKAQLNNMEACYIEKKKEVEGLQGKSRCIKSLVEQRNLAENMLRKISVAAQKKLPTFGAALRFNDEVKEILRGAND